MSLVLHLLLHLLQHLLHAPQLVVGATPKSEWEKTGLALPSAPPPYPFKMLAPTPDIHPPLHPSS